MASQSYVVCASQDLAAGKQCASMGGRKFPGRVFEAPEGRDSLQRLLHELPLVDLKDSENIYIKRRCFCLWCFLVMFFYF